MAARRYVVVLAGLLVAVACSKPVADSGANTSTPSATAGFRAPVPPADPWSAADFATVRLSPAAFPELPRNIVQALLHRGCTIPQLWGEEQKPHNVIQGEFARPGQTDWAVLCSRDRKSAVLVFWAAAIDAVDEATAVPDLGFLQGVGDDQIGFSRRIGVASREYILDHYREYGGPEPPPIDHDGIEDAFAGKASAIAYFYKGEWLTLTGAD